MTERPAIVTIEESGLGEKPWAVIITRPGETIPRALWERYASQADAVKGADAARAYLRDTVRGVVERKGP